MRLWLVRRSIPPPVSQEILAHTPVPSSFRSLDHFHPKMWKSLPLIHISSTLAITCYNPPKNVGTSGTAQDGNYTSCNINQEESMCCRSKKIGPWPPDACLESGLCINTAGSAPTYWRESCTDPTWTSPYCLNVFNVCSSDENNNAQVTLCPGTTTKYCCGDNNTACCSTASEISIPNIDDPSTSTSGLSRGAKAGIALAIVVVAFLAIVTVLLLIRRKRRNKAKIEEIRASAAEILHEKALDKQAAVNVLAHPRFYSRGEDANSRPELHSFPVPWELPDGSIRVNELDAGLGRRR
ncbi:uncharacterized protein LY89DRAFT_784628 [Mollisia scopiformis]|uniref:Uncharacterized protein n=1 Tax=Mollisia scopiformis TaxID=149040 RepID=A0A194X0P3_MOLSC|nr:uncharacterized protein LY89DRAFT_784628 [Mollisia scopiformis]KUJ13760.1 hypothetical protein LY89DRAFT_784628 [Mollisia scopiformis]